MKKFDYPETHDFYGIDMITEMFENAFCVENYASREESLLQVTSDIPTSVLSILCFNTQNILNEISITAHSQNYRLFSAIATCAKKDFAPTCLRKIVNILKTFLLLRHNKAQRELVGTQ